MRLAYALYMLRFKEPAGTSRGVLNQKPTCFIKIYDEKNPECYGLGEAALFPGLSPEAGDHFGMKIIQLLANVALGRPTDLSSASSIQYGFEQAINDFANGGKGIYFPSDFTAGNSSIEINGLIWMGDFNRMIQRIDEKVAAGFRCIKMKVGALEWEKELEMIKYVRESFPSHKLQLRLDANGGFTYENALSRLDSLARYDIHSIEQPIKAGSFKEMAEICERSPIPVALDEELIGKSSTEERRDTLDSIHPAYIILKPALCGGFSGAEEWINLANERNIGWWVTSALESNIGLNALAQWVATLRNSMPQGLGTGNLFLNNIETPVFLEKDRLHYDPAKTIDRAAINALDWRE